jgi:hypothetical protein
MARLVARSVSGVGVQLIAIQVTVPPIAMLPAVIRVDGQPARKRLTLSIWAALASMAVLVSGLVMLGLAFWYDLEDFHAVTSPSQDSYTADDNGAGGLALLLFTMVGLVVIGVLILVLGALTATLPRGSGFAYGLTLGLTAAFALSCGALSLFESGDTQAAARDPNNYVVTTIHDPATTPRWASWSDTAGEPVIMGGAGLATIVLLLPSTRRDLRVRRRPIEVPVETGSGPDLDQQ